MRMSVNSVSTIFSYESWVITPPIGCSQSYRNSWPPLEAKQILIASLPHLENERQSCINDFWSCVLGNHTIDRLETVKMEFLAAIMGKPDWNTLPAPSWQWASTERQQLLVMYHGSTGGRQVANCHKWTISCLYTERWKWNAPCPILKMCVNRVSTIVSLPSWLIIARCSCSCLFTLF